MSVHSKVGRLGYFLIKIYNGKYMVNHIPSVARTVRCWSYADCQNVWVFFRSDCGSAKNTRVLAAL